MDYSKWDKMANEVDDEETKSGQPRVTTLRQPQSITIGKDGYSFGPPRSQKAAKPSKPASARPGALDYSKWDHIGDDDSDGGGGGGDDDEDDDDDKDADADAEEDADDKLRLFRRRVLLLDRSERVERRSSSLSSSFSASSITRNNSLR